jgi:hypothetical protein
MALPVRPVPNSIIARWPGNRLVGTMVIGCVVRQEAAESCAGFLTLSVRATVTGQSSPIRR